MFCKLANFFRSYRYTVGQRLLNCIEHDYILLSRINLSNKKLENKASEMSTYLDMDTCASCLRHQNDAKNVGRTKDRLIFAIFVIATFSLLISIVVLLMQLTSTGSDKVVADLKAKYRQLEERLEQLQLLCNKNERHEVKEVQKLDRALEQDIAVDTHKQLVIGSNPYNTSMVEVSTDTDLSDLKKHRVKRQQSHRNKNKCRKKSRKNKGLTFIQIEGRGVQEMLQDKNVTGFWSPASWLKLGSKRYNAASKVFKMDDINETGKLRILKAGLYLIYAQFTLVGNPTTGFHVSIEHKSKASEKRLQCDRYSDTTVPHNIQSCFTMGIVELKEKEEIFIQENPNNTGANYSKLSYFGLIKLADLK